MTLDLEDLQIVLAAFRETVEDTLVFDSSAAIRSALAEISIALEHILAVLENHEDRIPKP